jgi:GDP-L-fucose synthase
MSDDGLIFVAGHRGLVGSAIVRRLEREFPDRLLVASRAELDLTCQEAVYDFFSDHRPSEVYLAAARVGGIKDNSDHPAEFIRENILIQTNVIDAAWRHGSRKLLFLGSSCIYPKMAPQPLRPEYLLSGPLEPTNQAYAVAKIAGIEMCHSYRTQYGFDAVCVMPTNLYGPEDRFDPERSHVIPALMYKFAEAKRLGALEVTIWGSGRPRREFLYVDDFADACYFLMSRNSEECLVNVGCGLDVSIRHLADTLQRVCDFQGALKFDERFPDGTSQKRLDVSLINSLGWRARTDLESGLRKTWEWYCNSIESGA